MTAIHELKTDPEFFWAAAEGKKPFEVRKNDRNFKVGDYIMLREYDRTEKKYTAYCLLGKITYLLDNPDYCKEGYVTLGVQYSKPEKGARYDD